MSLSKERSLVGFVLVVTSFLLYVVHYFVFHNTHDILFYLLFNLAFIPINVLVVTLIIDKLLSERERRDRMEKLNMVIGVFFSEVGTPLLIYLSDSDPNLETMRKDLIVTADWTETEFGRISDLLKKYPFKTNIQLINLENLGSFLGKEKNFLLRLLENPLLLEHETFTELLRAVFHLTEELVYRNNLTGLSENDLVHLTGDLNRVYFHLVHEWVDYMKHLKNNYPYLFSLAMRTNPFDQTASPFFK